MIFVQGEKAFYRKNDFAQTILLKALADGVTDINEMRKLAGLSKAADVYRTLDKLSLRQEYHEAFARQGITFDEILAGIRQLSMTANDKTRLAAYQTLLRSLGLDKYDKGEEGGKNWEDIISDLSENKKKQAIEGEIVDYEVDCPAVPEDEAKKRQEEKELTGDIYVV